MNKEEVIKSLKKELADIKAVLQTPMLERTDRMFYTGKMAGIEIALGLLKEE